MCEMFRIRTVNISQIKLNISHTMLLRGLVRRKWVAKRFCKNSYHDNMRFLQPLVWSGGGVGLHSEISRSRYNSSNVSLLVRIETEWLPKRPQAVLGTHMALPTPFTRFSESDCQIGIRKSGIYLHFPHYSRIRQKHKNRVF